MGTGASTGRDQERRARRPRLDRRTIVLAAIEVLDEVGIDELSTRRLAERLGVRSPTLYWHVRSKDELLDLIAEELCADAFDIDRSAPWRRQLEQGMHQFREMVVAHRDVATLLRRRPATGPNRLDHIETTLSILLSAGFSPHDAAAISRLLAAHVLAAPLLLDPVARRDVDPATGDTTSTEAGSLERFPSLHRLTPSLEELSEDALFDLGIEIILDGIEGRLEHRAGG